MSITLSRAYRATRVAPDVIWSTVQGAEEAHRERHADGDGDPDLV